MKEPIESLKEVTDISCSKGNYTYNSYMHGMANGLILAMAIMEDKEPKYLEVKEYEKDKKKQEGDKNKFRSWLHKAWN